MKVYLKSIILALSLVGALVVDNVMFSGEDGAVPNPSSLIVQE
jgi:hypothetical protein